MNYNTERSDLILPEYGRNVHQMVDHLLELTDPTERNKGAVALIAVMGQLHPDLRDSEDYNHKLWDHLFIMSNFKLDVLSPYPIPIKEEFEHKPNRVPYPTGVRRYRHYGKIITSIISESIKEEDPVVKESLSLMIANLMKKTFLQWNKNTVDDAIIWTHLKELSNGELIQPEGAELDVIRLVIKEQSHLIKKKSKSKRRY